MQRQEPDFNEDCPDLINIESGNRSVVINENPVDVDLFTINTDVEIEIFDHLETENHSNNGSIDLDNLPIIILNDVEDSTSFCSLKSNDLSQILKVQSPVKRKGVRQVERRSFVKTAEQWQKTEKLKIEAKEKTEKDKEVRKLERLRNKKS